MTIAANSCKAWIGNLTTTGYYERIKGECAELARQVREAKVAADESRKDYEAKVQASRDMDVGYAYKHFMTEQKNQARGRACKYGGGGRLTMC